MAVFVDPAQENPSDAILSRGVAEHKMTDDRVCVVIHSALQGGRLYAVKLEMLCDDFRYMVCQWQKALWILVSVPEEECSAAEDLAEEMGLVLEGTPPYAVLEQSLLPFPLLRARTLNRKEGSELTLEEEKALIEKEENKLYYGEC